MMTFIQQKKRVYDNDYIKLTGTVWIPISTDSKDTALWKYTPEMGGCTKPLSPHCLAIK